MMDRERFQKWKTEREDADRVWRSEEARKDRVWREKQAKSDCIWHWGQVVIIGVVGGIVALVAAFISKGDTTPAPVIQPAQPVIVVATATPASLPTPTIQTTP